MKILDLDMAAAVYAATGEQPELKDRQAAGRVGFTFSDNEATTSAVALYVTGELLLEAKHLLKVRGDLYKQLRSRRSQ